MAMADNFLVDQILPAKEIHLIGGPSGAGKTTLMLQVVQDFSLGKSIFGHPSHPLPFCFISLTRSRFSILSTARKIGFPRLPLVAVMEEKNTGPRTITSLYQTALRAVPDVKVLFLDSLHQLCPGNIIRYDEVSSFLRATMCVMQELGITIIARTETAKPEEWKGRQRVLGSVAWTERVSTIITVEQVTDSPNDHRRRVTILPRNAAPEVWPMIFNEQGRIVSSRLGEQYGDEQYDNFVVLVAALLEAEGEVRFKQIEEMAASLEISRRTIYNYLERMKQEGRIESVGLGLYRARHPN